MIRNTVRTDKGTFARLNFAGREDAPWCIKCRVRMFLWKDDGPRWRCPKQKCRATCSSLYPLKYWQGKKRYPETVAKVSAALKAKGYVAGDKNYFKTHKYEGKDHSCWKGDEVGYHGLHGWVKRVLGRPDTCEFCQRSGLSGHQIHWANKSREYKRDITDWLRLCAKCHWHYDRDEVAA